MLKQENNYAFIDGQNLNLGIKRLGWALDFKKFRVYLREKKKPLKDGTLRGVICRNSVCKINSFSLKVNNNFYE